MKKIIYAFASLATLLAITSCERNNDGIEDNKDNTGDTAGDSTGEQTVITRVDTPTVTINKNVVTWSSVENAGSYVIKLNDTILDPITETTYTILATTAGNYKVQVKAVPSDTTKYKESYYADAVTYTKQALTQTDIFFVGDSTVCEFDEKYFYQRVGYGTASVVSNYFDTNYITVHDLALSGRSSKSFIAEDNYQTLKSNVGKGDYVFIGFGHNDEKTEDAARGTYANKDESDNTSFKYYLYNYYIKVALDAGATPILCTPISRLSTDSEYTYNSEHITEDGGDYPEAIRELGTKYNVAVVDLTAYTSSLYKELGFDGAKKFHAVTSGSSATEPNWQSVDKTHINIYGAKTMCYYITEQIKALNLDLADYIKDGITAPTEENDLVKDDDYTYVPYNPVDWSSYEAKHMFATSTSGWYGTAFGDLGGDPVSIGNDPENPVNTNGYVAYEDVAGEFIVGQYSGKENSSATSTIGYTGSQSYKGKIAGTSEGYAFAFTKISSSRNFTITANYSIIAQNGYTTKDAGAPLKQAGFGLMLHDDCYIPTKDAGIVSNSVSASLITDGTNGSTMNVNYARQSAASIVKGDSINDYYKVGDTGTATLKRVGQIYYCTITFDGVTYETTYTDYYFDVRDTDYFYVGMFGTRGTAVKWTNVSLTDDGAAGQA